MAKGLRFGNDAIDVIVDQGDGDFLWVLATGPRDSVGVLIFGTNGIDGDFIGEEVIGINFFYRLLGASDEHQGVEDKSNRGDDSFNHGQLYIKDHLLWAKKIYIIQYYIMGGL